jgi:hypothetical protein
MAAFIEGIRESYLYGSYDVTRCDLTQRVALVTHRGRSFEHTSTESCAISSAYCTQNNACCVSPVLALKILVMRLLISSSSVLSSLSLGLALQLVQSSLDILEL